jgi:integrase
VLPLIGPMKVPKVDGTVADKSLTKWFTEGRVPGAGMGFPKTHSLAVVAMVRRMREDDPPFTYADIAMLVKHQFPEEAECGFTKNTVAGIWKREREQKSLPIFDPGLAESTVGSIQAMLQEAWSWALERNTPPLAESNPWATAEGAIEREPGKPQVTWTVDQLIAFFDWVRERGSRYLTLWKMAVATGERESGVLGLHWVDVDLAARTLAWRWYVKQNQRTNRPRIEPYGKSDSGRQIPISSYTVAMLGSQFASVARERLAHGHVHTCSTRDFECPLPGYHDRGLVFPTINGNYTSGKNMLRQFQVNIERFNAAHPDSAPLPRVHIHSLRRLWNSVGAGEKVAQVHRMAIIGQYTVRSNDGYTESLGGVDGELRDAVETVNERIFGSE